MQPDTLAAEVASLISDEPDLIANFANVSALRFHSLNVEKGNCINWLGFYRVHERHNDVLVLGPFQGHSACIRIPFGQGVCGTAALNRKTVVVPNVEEFPGHISCDSNSKSEIVLPVFDEHDKLIAVLDIDASVVGCFGEKDAERLERVVAAFRRKTPNSPRKREVKHAAVHTSEK